MTRKGNIKQNAAVHNVAQSKALEHRVSVNNTDSHSWLSDLLSNGRPNKFYWFSRDDQEPISPGQVNKLFVQWSLTSPINLEMSDTD